VVQSVLSPNVQVQGGARVEASVLLDGVQIGRGAEVRQAIIDQDVVVPDGFSIGCDPALDRSRFAISSGGVVIVPRGIPLG